MRDEKRDNILNAAKSRFDRFGLKKTTIDEIAKEAGIGKGTVYLYFKSKEEIFLAVQRNVCQMVLEKYRAVLRREKHPAQQLVKLAQTRVATTIELLECNPLNADILVESHTETEYKIVRDEFYEDERQIFRSVLEAGNASGQFKISDLDKTAWSIGMMLHGLTLSVLLREKDSPKPNSIKFALETFIHGFSGN